MKVLDAGHRYLLSRLDDETNSGDALLQFVKREGVKFPGNVDSYPGTTSQEVVRALLHRAQYVHSQIPCWQTKLSLYLYGGIIWLYEHRAAKNHGRSAPGWREAIWGKTCGKCGHVGCEGKCRP